jgi:drug/metabolite transporter (DMT)-like permease
MKIPKWLVLAVLVPIFWGIWGALTEIPEKWISPPFPPTLGYAVWSLTMVPIALIVLRSVHWKIETSTLAIIYGCAVGFSGAVGQLLLFHVLTQGPAYTIFPIICLSPVITILLSALILRERTYTLATTGIVLALVAIFLLSVQRPTEGPAHGYAWLFWTISIFFMWGLQAYFMKSSAPYISSEGLFFYMTATGVVLSPIALLMTNFHEPINWGWKGIGLTAAIQSFNAVGCLLFVYAVRYGKAIVVVPMVNGGYPLVTIIVSLAIYHSIPNRFNLAGMVVSVIAIFLMAFDEVRHAPVLPVASAEPG